MINLFNNHTYLQGDYSIKTIKVLDQIGRGNSYVYKILINNQHFALKQIQIKNDHQSLLFFQQIKHMKQLSLISDDLIKYYGYFITMLQNNQYVKKKYAHIVMQCAQMNLQNLITVRTTQSHHFTKLEIIQITRFLITAYSHLEKNRIAHCDIKPENILILNSKSMTMKLCDVGSTKILNSQTIQQATILGTVPFLSPQLINIKSHKIKSINIFKSDVFSFGLVILYLITNKKFTTKQRLQIPQPCYIQILSQWIKQAKQIINYQSCLVQILIHSLLFQQHNRPLFNQLKQIFLKQQQKQQIYLINKLTLLNQQSTQFQHKLYGQQHFRTTSSKKISINANKLKNINYIYKINNKTTSIGFNKNLRSIQKNLHISPMHRLTKRQSACLSTNSQQSPQKTSKQLTKTTVIYIKQSQKHLIPFQSLNQQQIHFILFTPCNSIKYAQSISIYKPCLMNAINLLADTNINKLYLQYQGFQGEGVNQNCFTLKAKKIFANFRKCQIIGGYNTILASFSGPDLQSLQLDLTGSNIQWHELLNFLDLLKGRSMKYLGIIWQTNLITAQQHTSYLQKLSKMQIKKLLTVMNDNFIKYQKQSRWLLPKHCQILYLQYKNNFIQKIISNLTISITNNSIKQLYLNFTNNNLHKCQINMLLKSISSIQKLQKLILNISLNPIQDLSYIITSIKNYKYITLLQIKLHHTSIPIHQFRQIILEISYLFNSNLNICKITYDRCMIQQQFKNIIEKTIFNHKIVKIDILGYDNKYFMVFIKKIQKNNKNKLNQKIGKNNNNNNNTTIFQLKNTLTSKQFKKICCCLSFYSNHLNYDNYICLSCTQYSQITKYQYYCKYCIQNCKHKGHSIVKIYQRIRCCCSYSGQCKSVLQKRVCAQQLGIAYKKIYKCFKCQKLYCLSCIQKCQESHKNWIEQTKFCVGFVCGTPIC